MNSTPMKRLFIANRGEIARRIALTARRLGLETVAVCENHAPPAFLVETIDQFVSVPEESPALYLDADRMVKLALEAKADAVHPGFGFLSENAGFARKVEDAGLTWVGPNPRAIAEMASKSTARDLAEQAGTPCIQGISGFHVPETADGDFSEIEAFASATGYPLLIKAAYGGGGKGMRLVYEPSELKTAILRARSEAENAFGDGTLVCEKYVEAPRHVEVQILGDKHGEVVAFGDRDCSVQRRHQKILEEAPAPGLTEATREAMQDAARRLAREVDYDSAGTVEFLIDWSDTSRNADMQNFYFLEMNTRLQVEHPVTEEVFGVDLVEWQLRVAQGEALPKSLSTLTPRGHSIEARLYAEDVEADFLPSPGPVARFEPGFGPGIRWETGLDAVSEITGRFDPMIAKLIATGADRDRALSRLGGALARTFFAGPKANLALVRHLVTASDFRGEPVTTRFLTEHLDRLLSDMNRQSETVASRAQTLLDRLEAGDIQATRAAGPREPDPVRVTASAFARGGQAARKPSSSGEQGERLHICSEEHGVMPGAVTTQVFSGAGLLTTGHGAETETTAFHYAFLKSQSERKYWISVDGYHFGRQQSRSSSRTSARGAAGSDEIIAPVPGKVVDIHIETGSSVEEGQPIFVLESMKMEFEVKAGKTGIIKDISVAKGDQVSSNQHLATWDDSQQAAKE